MSTKIEWQQATITAIEPQTARISSFFFKLPHPFGFVAGQHVDVRLTAADGYQAQRSYSIASAPSSADDLELVIERLDDGEVSPFFHDVAAVGDAIELRGPIGGYFQWSPEVDAPVLLVGGGSGVVPLMSMIRHRAARRSAAPMALLLSVRTREDMPFREELLGLADRNDGFHLALTTTRSPPPRASDYHRRVDAAMLAEVLQRLPATPATVFVCGSDPFVEAAAAGLIASAVSADVIRTERYGG